MPSCFISYARSDDEPFVGRLRERLIARGIEVWWDRESMGSVGVHFLQEIQDGIRTHAWFLLVSGPAAAGSDYVAHEIEVTRAACTPTVLVLRTGARHDVPARFRHHHQFDLRSDETGQDFEGLVRTLLGAAPVPGRVLGPVPSVPAHVLRRDVDLESVVRDALADVTDPLAISSVAAASSVTGMAGAGKTVLAALTARDCRIRHHFPGGVVFVRLGPASTAQSAAAEIRGALRPATALLGDAPHPGDAAALVELHETARSAKRLFVLDDVWDAEQLEPILRSVAGTPSRILLTTRHTDLGRASGVVHHRLGLLDPRTAHRFLLDWAGSDATATELPDGVAEVATACGYLALGLAVAGFLVGDGLSWKDLAVLLSGADLRALDVGLGSYEHAGIHAAIDVSARRLESERHGLWHRYLDLALFADAVPRSVVALHWDAASVAVARLDLQQLIRRSLLIDTGDDAVTLHDLHRSYLLARGADPGALAGRLLDALGDDPSAWIDRARCEPWLRRNMVTLLCTAERDGQMLALQRVTCEGAAPAWFELRRASGELHEFWLDLERADRRHRKRLSEPELLGAVIERAAVRATLRSFSRRSPELTLAAVHAGVLSPLAAWQQARQMPRGDARVRALAQLVPVHPAPERTAAALAVLDELPTVPPHVRVDVITRLVAQLPSRELCDGVLAAADDAGGITPAVLIALAPHLDTEQRQRARSIADRMDAPERRIALAGLTLGADEADADLALLFPSLEMTPDEAVAVLVHAACDDRSPIAAWLAPLVDRIDGSHLQHTRLWRALPADRIARFLSPQPDLRDVEPISIAHSLTEIVRAHPQLTAEALELARRLRPPYLAIMVLGAAARAADDTPGRRLVAEIVERIEAAIEPGSNDWMADDMGDAFGAVPIEMATSLADLAERIGSAFKRCRTIAALVPRLREDHARQVVRRELGRLDRNGDGNKVRYALAALASVIGREQIDDALLVADGPRDNGFDNAFLATMAAHLEPPRRTEVYAWSLSTCLPGRPNATRPGWTRAFLVEEALELDPTPATAAVAVQLTATITEPEYRAGALAVLARVAPTTTVWSQVEAALAAIDESGRRARATARVARLGPLARREELVGRCLELVGSVPIRDQQVEMAQDLLRTGDQRAVDFAMRLLGSSWEDRFAELYGELPLGALESIMPVRSLLPINDRLSIAFAARLADAGREDEALAALRAAGPHAQNEGWQQIAPYLSSTAVAGLLDGPRGLNEPATAAVCERLAELGELPRAVEIVRRDVRFLSWRLPTLAALAVLDARSGRTTLLDEVLGEVEVVSENEHVDSWSRAIAAVGTAIASLPSAARPSRLHRAVEIASSRARLQAVPALWALAPAYAGVAGVDGVWEAFEAVRRVLGWWPGQDHLAAHRRS